MQKILVTRCTGYIGSVLIQQILNLGYNVREVDRGVSISSKVVDELDTTH